MDKYPNVVKTKECIYLVSFTRERIYNRMIELDRKASNIKNRTKCALENINTTKKLKDNFPEAYVILTETSKEDVKRNECDNIEKLRAELSKL